MATWNIQVPEALNEAVDRVIDAGRYQSKAEFIRSAVREKLERMGIGNSRET